MREIFLLASAAALEVGGDALIRGGLKGRGSLLLLAGAAALVSYGFLVNLTGLDFGRLMGIYIVLVFLLAQGVSLFFFHERLSAPLLVGGSLILAGGILLTLWRPT